MTANPSGWYSTAGTSSSPSIKPYSSSYSRETHDMYNELGVILCPSKIIPSSTNSKSKSLLGSNSKLSKTMSYVMKWLGAS